jgi:acetamidase/formamidase
VRAIAAAHDIDVTRPFPFRVEGVASTLRLHVLNHSCPIAEPDGPKPWRFFGEGETTVLVGFYAENSAGRLTHHGQETHTHALLPGRDISGHLDEVALLSGARVYLPVR